MCVVTPRDYDVTPRDYDVIPRGLRERMHDTWDLHPCLLIQINVKFVVLSKASLTNAVIAKVFII